MKPWNSIPRSDINQPNGVAGLDIGSRVLPSQLHSAEQPPLRLHWLTTNTGELPVFTGGAGGTASYVDDANVPGGRALQLDITNSGDETETYYVHCDLPASVAVRSNLQWRMWCDDPDQIPNFYIYAFISAGTDIASATPKWYRRVKIRKETTLADPDRLVAETWQTYSIPAHEFTAQSADVWLQAWADGGDVSGVGQATIPVQRIAWRIHVYAGQTVQIKLGPVAFVAAPKGVVLFDYDDGNATDRAVTWPLHQQYGLRPGNLAIIPESIGTAGKMTLADVQWMRDQGWCLVNHVHDIIDATMPDETLRHVIASGQLWGNANGLPSMSLYRVPRGGAALHPLARNILEYRGVQLSRGSARATLSDETTVRGINTVRTWNSVIPRDRLQLGGCGALRGSGDDAQLSYEGSRVQQYISAIAAHRMMGVVTCHEVSDDPTDIGQTPEFMGDLFAHVRSLIDAGQIEPYHDYASYLTALSPPGELYYDAEGWPRSRATGRYIL